MFYFYRACLVICFVSEKESQNARGGKQLQERGGDKI